jgi:hypothetical protein
MSFEFLKELVALASAVISFTTALSSGKLMQRTYGAVEPIKWGAVCFVLGGAFTGAVVFVLREQQFAPIGADPLIQWSGVFGFAGAVLGLITTHFVKKDVDEIGQATLQGNDIAHAQPRPQEQIRVVYVLRSYASCHRISDRLECSDNIFHRFWDHRIYWSSPFFL